MAGAKTSERSSSTRTVKRRGYVRFGAPSRANAISVPITGETLRTLKSKKKMIGEIAEILAKLLQQTERSGHAATISVTIDPDGSSHVDQQRIGTLSAGQAAGDALGRARDRGRIRAAQILDAPEMLSADTFAERLGVSRMTVNSRRLRNELLGLDGAKRGFRFPDWQVDEDGKAFDAMPRLFELLGPSPWTVYRFLVQRHNVLDGESAKDALRRGDSQAVLDAAESIARGDFA